MLSLTCFILGDDAHRKFTVKIDKTENVDALKDLIMQKNLSLLGNVDVKNIDLWQVSLPIDDFEIQLRNLKLGDYTKLVSYKKLTIFSKDVADDCLHIIAKAPESWYVAKFFSSERY